MEDNELWKKWSGCQCVQEILIQNGYDNVNSLKLLSESSLKELENCIQEDWQRILNSVEKSLEKSCKKCTHLEIYSKQKKFAFLIGHKTLLLKWCQELNEVKIEEQSFFIDNPAFPPMLQNIISTALNNTGKEARARRFPLLLDFAIYLYIMAGKTSYEIIAANIPFPKAKTISKFYFCLIFCLMHQLIQFSR